MRLLSARSTFRTQRGMSLLEVMLLTFVLGGALIAGYIALKSRDAADVAQSQSAVLAEADRALASFAAANSRLPCPDTDRDGIEDCAGTTQKGWLPYRTMGLEGAGARSGVGELRFLVQRTAVELTTATDSWQPLMYKDNTALYTGVRDFTPTHNISTPDLCGNLVMGAAVVLAAGHAQVTAAVPRPVAYALAHPGNRDENGDGNLFDGINGNAGNSLEAPERVTQVSTYDDRVVERSYASLALALDCARLNASLNQVSLATETVEQVNAQKAINTVVASLLTAKSIAKALVATFKVVGAVTQLATAIGYMTTSASLLSAAIASCVVLVGCFEIPHAAASVAAAAVSITASSVAIVASAVSVALQVTATALNLSAAIVAGVSTAVTPMDISAAVAQSLTSRNDATTRKNDAYTIWQASIGTEASFLANKDAKIAAAYTAAHAIVTSANTAPNHTGTLAAITLIDSYVTSTVNAAAAWMAAEKNYGGAITAYDNAVKTTSGGPAGSNPSLVAALADFDVKIAAESDPVKKQALIDAKAAMVNGSTGAASNTQQTTQLAGQLANLTTQINGLNAQIVSDPGNTALIAQRDQLVDQRAQLQAQYNTLALDVPAALANKNAADAARAAAKQAFHDAYDLAVAKAKINYSEQVCTTVTVPVVPATTPATFKNVTTCITTARVYDGSAEMGVALRQIFHTETTVLFITFISSYDDGIYFQWYQKQQATIANQAAYNEAVAKETQATNAYNSLAAINTGASGTGAAVNAWNGAEAILKEADRKGGIQ